MRKISKRTLATASVFIVLSSICLALFLSLISPLFKWDWNSVVKGQTREQVEQDIGQPDIVYIVNSPSDEGYNFPAFRCRKLAVSTGSEVLIYKDMFLWLYVGIENGVVKDVCKAGT